ncbi:1-phosphofructokinase family hexose kinase [Streptomyces hygroscopicus]|uniref:1-phosphofructokinase family hexose kinase n=1 Tax=Streptomyces hygroscopicus TaxID=1912 RepID=UPI00367CBB67
MDTHRRDDDTTPRTRDRHHGGHRIRIVGPNPAMDRIEYLDRLEPHTVNRSLETRILPGGKSLIVARAVSRLGGRPVLYGFLGGVVGRYISEQCATLGIEDRHTVISGETRINPVLVERSTGHSTVINETGPTIRPQEAERLLRALADDCAEGDHVVLTGSLPPGLGPDYYGELVTAVRSRGARALVDTSGPALVAAVRHDPWLVKCNVEEFTTAFGVPAASTDPADLVPALRDLLGGGLKTVVVTLGAQGLLAVTADRALTVLPPAVRTVNATGSGDTFLAAFALACARGASLEEALRQGTAAAAANAAVLEPDLGPSPDLTALLAGVRVRHPRPLAPEVTP